MIQQQGQDPNYQLFDELMAGVTNYLHDDAVEQIAQQMSQSTPDTLNKVISATAYRVTVDASHQAESMMQGEPLELDFLLGVATETIDMLIDIAKSVTQVGNEGDLRLESLVGVVTLHMEQVGDDPEQQAAAQELLSKMANDGTLDEGMAFIEKRMGQTSMQPQQEGQPQGLLGA